jgi:uncharacterized protein with NAD-binding domain and iron-sulfur cluster
MKRVVVIGGGVAGLTAAHELAERGFEVHVVEQEGSGAQVTLGGKAASQLTTCTVNPRYRAEVAGPPTLTLPGEHGFRFFPSFYEHLTDTMRRTPFFDRNSVPTSARERFVSCADNFVPVYVAAFGFDFNEDILPVNRQLQPSITAVLDLLRQLLKKADYTLRDLAQYELKIFEFMTSCPERREAEYEAMSWWDFAHGMAGASLTSPPITYSPAFDADIEAAPKLLVAMSAKEGAARAQGEILVQMLLDQVTISDDVDRVLNGPSNDQWLTPWRTYLEGLGVSFHRGRLRRFETTGGHPVPDWSVVPAGLPPPGAVSYYVLALSMHESYRALFGNPGSPALLNEDQIENPDAPLRVFKDLTPVSSTAWLSGMQFYLRDDIEIVRGHVGLTDSPWGLSVVSQSQFWGTDFAARYGHGEVRTILSVDVGNWDAPGLGGAPSARNSSQQEFVWQVWNQLREGTRTERITLPDWPSPAVDPPSLVVAYHVDDNITWGPNSATGNKTPMFINRPASWNHRPGPLEGGYRVRLGKLVVAGDYTQTYTGLPCMESANESARHAVNAILDHVESNEVPPLSRPYERCAIYELEAREPADVEIWKELDRKLFQRGVPHVVHTLGWQTALRAVPDNIPATEPAVDLLAGLISGLYPIIKLL